MSNFQTKLNRGGWLTRKIIGVVSEKDGGTVDAGENDEAAQQEDDSQGQFLREIGL